MRKDLPARPNVEHLKSQAKDLLAAYHQKDKAALERFRESLPSARGLDDDKLVTLSFALHDAQSVIAREYGFTSFAELRAHVESQSPSSEALRSLMAAHPNAPLPQRVLEAMATAAAATPKPGRLSGTTVLPALPLRGALLTPGATAPMSVGRASSLAAVERARQNNSLLAVFTQTDAANESPETSDLHPVGCTAQLLSTIEGESYGTFLVLRGVQWVTLLSLERTEPYLVARVAPFDVRAGDPGEVRRLEARLREKVRPLVDALPGAERLRAMTAGMDALELADATVANLPCSVEEKARYANESSVAARLERVLALMGEAG